MLTLKEACELNAGMVTEGHLLLQLTNQRFYP